jgi:hypothetical protein
MQTLVRGAAAPMRARARAAALSVALGAWLAGCGIFTDAATRLAYDLEAAASRVGTPPGSRYTLVHRTPSKSGECTGPYKVQVDKVGALVIWCMSAAGETVSSHSTTYHSRFVDTAATTIVDKPAQAPLTIELERVGSRVVVVAVR